MNDSESPQIIKKRRPQPRIREPSPSCGPSHEESGDEELPLADLIELRKLRKARQGIDASKLIKGDSKKKKKRPKEEEVRGGLQTYGSHADEDGHDIEGKDAKARRAVRASNFTQQTNVLDVDKHMMAYIEENLKRTSDPQEVSKKFDPEEELFSIPEKWDVSKKVGDEGSVTNSLTMLTAIPEVDLGMDTRLKNIEETEKAKRAVAEGRQGRRRPPTDEEHLIATRFYRPNIRQKSEADILRDAKLEAMGLPTRAESTRSHQEPRPQMATDEIVMERFKKRMRK